MCNAKIAVVPNYIMCVQCTDSDDSGIAKLHIVCVQLKDRHDSLFSGISKLHNVCAMQR